MDKQKESQIIANVELFQKKLARHYGEVYSKNLVPKVEDFVKLPEYTDTVSYTHLTLPTIA